MPADPRLYKRLSDSESLTDVLIQMEDFLDSLDLYVFKNWINGEVVEGPEIRRYWVSMTLKYAYKDMPDPAGGSRLLHHGAKVFFRKSTEENAVEVKNENDLDPMKKPKVKTEQIWLVEIQIPRRFIEELDDSDLELHADEEVVDAEKVSDARDENIDDEDAFTDETEKPEDSEEETGDL